MEQGYLIQVLVGKDECDAVLERLNAWFYIEHPDGFFGMTSLDHFIDLTGPVPAACVAFPAAEDAMAGFVASLAVAECGLAGREYRVVPRS